MEFKAGVDRFAGGEAAGDAIGDIGGTAAQRGVGRFKAERVGSGEAVLPLHEIGQYVGVPDEGHFDTELPVQYRDPALRQLVEEALFAVVRRRFVEPVPFGQPGGGFGVARHDLLSSVEDFLPFGWSFLVIEDNIFPNSTESVRIDSYCFLSR